MYEIIETKIGFAGFRAGVPPWGFDTAHFYEIGKFLHGANHSYGFYAMEKKHTIRMAGLNNFGNQDEQLNNKKSNQSR